MLTICTRVPSASFRHFGAKNNRRKKRISVNIRHFRVFVLFNNYTRDALPQQLGAWDRTTIVHYFPTYNTNSIKIYRSLLPPVPSSKPYVFVCNKHSFYKSRTSKNYRFLTREKFFFYFSRFGEINFNIDPKGDETNQANESRKT